MLFPSGAIVQFYQIFIARKLCIWRCCNDVFRNEHFSKLYSKYGKENDKNEEIFGIIKAFFFARVYTPQQQNADED